MAKDGLDADKMFVTTKTQLKGRELTTTTLLLLASNFLRTTTQYTLHIAILIHFQIYRDTFKRLKQTQEPRINFKERH